MISSVLGALTTSVMLFAPSCALASDQPTHIEALVNRVLQPAEQVNYTGIATYEYSGRRSIVRLSSGIQDGVRKRRIDHLDGPRRKVSVHSRPELCMPKPAEIRGGSAWSEYLVEQIMQSANYTLSAEGPSVIANRIVHRLRIQANDEHRFSYLVGLDETTRIVLQAAVLDAQGRVIEHFKFVEFMVDEELPDEAVTAGAACAREDAGFQLETGWAAQWMPKGFELRASEVYGSGRASSYFYTDGVSTLSLFVEPSDTSSTPAFDANLGATAVVHREVLVDQSTYSLSVVGEVPRETAKKIASQVRYFSISLERPD